MIAVLMYMKNNDKKRFLPFYDKIPEKFREFIIKKYKPFLNEKDENDDILYITLPLVYGEKKNNYEKWYNTIYNTLQKLNEFNITGAVLPEDDVFYSPVNIFRGRTINAIMTFEIAKKCLKIKNKDIQKSEFVVIDGNEKLTDIALKSLVENVNYLSVLTDREYFFDEIKDFAESERGLIINTFSSPKNQILKDADVIVNCSSDMENQDYYYKRNSIYIDIVKNHGKSLRISRKREDMLIVDGIGIKTDMGFLKSSLYEAKKYDKDKIFRKYFDRYEDFYEVYSLLKGENVHVSSLYFMDKNIL